MATPPKRVVTALCVWLSLPEDLGQFADFAKLLSHKAWARATKQSEAVAWVRQWEWASAIRLRDR